MVAMATPSSRGWDGANFHPSLIASLAAARQGRQTRLHHAIVNNPLANIPIIQHFKQSIGLLMFVDLYLVANKAFQFLEYYMARVYQ